MVYLGIGLFIGTCTTITISKRKRSGEDTDLDDLDIIKYMFWAILIWPVCLAGIIYGILEEINKD